ncbi:MAG TPA: 50S ribosomal protein L11 methyltransferase [Sphingobacteriaceae bacterium]
MNYKELIFTIVSGEDYYRDLLINALGEIGFDTFEETDLGFTAYIPSDQFDQERLDSALDPFKESVTFAYEVNLIPHKNWNEIWESNFEPLQIGDTCYVRATFHEPRPEFTYQIVIDPKMAFGTGHHQTTSMMMELMLGEDLNGLKVLDMGCGTGILAILASMLGAADVMAIDYDPVCFASTEENARINHVSNLRVACGSKEAIPDEQFDFILANINRNILLDQLETYVSVLKPGGTLMMSGFYADPDLEIIKNAAARHGLKYAGHRTQSAWVAAKFTF